MHRDLRLAHLETLAAKFDLSDAQGKRIPPAAIVRFLEPADTYAKRLRFLSAWQDLGKDEGATEGFLVLHRYRDTLKPSRPLADAFADRDQVESGIETAALRALIEELRAAARQDPLSPAVLLSYGLRLRAERLDLGRIIWGLTLGAPAGVLTSGLATVA